MILIWLAGTPVSPVTISVMRATSASWSPFSVADTTTGATLAGTTNYLRIAQEAYANAQ